MTKKKDKELLEFDHALQDVLNTEAGRLVFWELLSYCGIYNDIAGDNHHIHRSLGRREVGLYVMSLIDSIDDEYIFKIMKEARERNKRRENDNEHRKSKPALTDRDILSNIISDRDLAESGHYSDESDEWGSHDYGGAII
jgi:hypothetical protein